MKDPETELTYSALTGVRKQSVEDVERLFGEKVIKFMEKKNYEAEARYLKVVRNWRQAIDKRGLSDGEREKLRMDFLKFILEDLIPWNPTDQNNFSLLEVNR